MIKFLSRRLLGGLGVLLLTSLLSFTLIYLAPGEPAEVILTQRLGRIPTKAETSRLAAEYGFDRSPVIQYLDWTSHALRGDFGTSLRSGEPVMVELRSRMMPTLLLAGMTTIFTVVVGIPLGLWAAVQERGAGDRFSRFFSLVGVSVPDFWLAFLLILVFSIYLRWLPTHGLSKPQDLILPVVSLGIGNVARLSRLARSQLLDTKHQDYLRTARAKGLPEWRVWLGHALPNGLIPLITLAVSQFSAIVSGSVVIETLFALPGIGQFYVLAVRYNDIPVIQATVLLISAAFILINLLTDLAYGFLDPRLRGSYPETF